VDATERVEGTIKDMSRPYQGGWKFVQLRGVKETVTGVFPSDCEVGDYVIVEGKYEEHPKYGKQFKSINVTKELPKDTMGIIQYLSIKLKWIGPIVSRRLVEAFGSALFEVIEHSPQRLSEVNGITPARAQEIHEKYVSIMSDRTIDVYFSTHGVTPSLLNRLIDTYGTKEKAKKQIEANPYILASDVWGIGFKKADAIAVSTGIKKESRRRLTAGIRYVLQEASGGEGHTCLPFEELVKRAVEILEAGKEKVVEVLNEMIAAGKLVDFTPGNDDALKDGNASKEEALPFEGDVDLTDTISLEEAINIVDELDATGWAGHKLKAPASPSPAATYIYTAEMWTAEIDVAQSLLKFVSTPHAAMISELSSDEINSLDQDQLRGLDLAMTSKIMVLAGGPGVGKTHLINFIIRAMGRDLNIALAAPTGKAAKRMSEATGGRAAMTIHRLLAFHPEVGFRHNQDNPLDVDVVVVDETSMVDVQLMASLLSAVNPEKTQLILVGDPAQLPSVSAGRVLGDIIESGIIPTVHLTTLHRQAAKSYINRNAQRINRGEKVELKNDGDSDFFFVTEEDKHGIAPMIEKVCVKFSAHYGFDLKDIQVLCPMKKGPAGTIELNRRLRPVINVEGVAIGGTPFLTGDRVIQTRNDYKKMVFNGDMGIVLGGDASAVVVMIDDREVEYASKDFEQLQMAYAMTIHKSQGSQFPVVVIPVHTTNFIMLQRSIIYTGITRAQRYVILVGTQKALNIAIKTGETSTSKRWSNLGGMLVRGGW